MHLYKTDLEIIAGIRQGDHTALSVLYKEHFGAINHFILNNNGSGDDAKDVYQEAVIIFYEKVTQDSLELNCKISCLLYTSDAADD